jgi:hypothetical protein
MGTFDLKMLSDLCFLEFKVIAKDCRETGSEKRQLQNEGKMPSFSSAFS